jgi:hypothetical protein
MIVNRHIGTSEPHNGLSPWVLNTPQQYEVLPKASVSNAVYTTANHFTSTVNSMAYSMAAGTQPDYPRNVVVNLKPNTGSVSLYSAGTIYVYGRDVFGSTRSESFAATGAAGSASDAVKGSVNFLRIDTISVNGLKFAAASSSARSDVSFYVGLGNKIGLPVPLISANGVYQVYLGTSVMDTSSGTKSTLNQYTAITGDYYVGGVSISTTLGSGTELRVEYKNLGYLAPYGSY